MALTAAEKALLLFIAQNAVFTNAKGLAGLIAAVQNEPVILPPIGPQAASPSPS